MEQYSLEEEKSIFKSLPGGYVRCAIDEGLSIIYMNERFLKILGWTEQEIRDRFENQYMNLVHPDDRETILEYVRRMIKGNPDRAFEDEIYRLTGKDGYHWVSDTTVKIEVAGQTFFQCIISDVSRFIADQEQRTHDLERLLNEAEERYEIIRALGAVYQELSVIDLEKQTYTVISGYGKTRRYRGVTGSLREFHDFVLTQILAEEESRSVREFLDFSTAADRLWDRQFTAQEFKGRNGEWYLVTLIVKNRDENGTVTHLLVSARNVNDQKSREMVYQKSLEKAVIEARRAGEAKSNFLSRMSHDIRTPLNGIIGLLKINETHFENRELLMENHQKMSVAANHLLALINDVLQMSKLEDGSVVLTHETICLAELTQDIVNIIVGRAIEAGIEWCYEKGKAKIPYPYIYGSPVHLRQIFLNIYGNCIKYNYPGGKITTIVDVTDEQNGICRYRWTISDTGIGMSKEFLKHIFDPFAQEKNDARSAYQGSGLGMAIVKSLLDQMGGTISIDSEVGVGSTFVIVIPFEVAPPPKQPKTQESERDIRGMNLMLAEDNDLNAEIAQVLLEDRGAKVTVAADGRQALECFASSRPGTFDAILMDVMMPVMDGMTAARAIRSLDRPDAASIPIIAMTANAFAEDAKRCLEAGMNAHLSKPLEMEKVTAAIWEYCRKE